MPSANRSYTRIKRETTFGEQATISAADKADSLRINSNSLGEERDFVESQAIRSDRARGRGVNTASRVSGDIAMEFLPAALDPVMPFLIGQSANLAAGADETITFAAMRVSLANHGRQIGDWLRFWDSSDAAVESVFARVTAVPTDGTFDVSIAPNAGSDRASGMSYLGNGLSRQSFSAEVGLADAADYFQYLGCVLNSMQVEVSTGGIVTATFNVLGAQSTHEAQEATDANSNDAASGRPANAVDDVRGFIDGVVLGDMTSISFSIVNNVREAQKIGTRTSEVSLGSCAISGSLSFLTNDFALYDDMVNRTAKALSFVIGTEDNWYAFDFPQIDFTGAQVNVEGLDTDVLMSMDFVGSVKDENMFRVTRGA